MPVAWLSARPGMTIGLDGHADQPESEGVPPAVQRVRAVREALVAGGIEPARIQVGEFGARSPVCVAQTDTCRDLNRRVEVLVSAPRS